MAADGDPGGPLVVLCQGHRCAALRRLADGGTGATEVPATVAGSPGGVLVTTGCLGPCALGALAGVAHRAGGGGRTSPAVWLWAVEGAERGAQLRRWLARGGPSGDPRREVPDELRGAVAGFGPAPELRPA
ncbi:hypothetical protein [Blastococcus sp. VKM Ac-2987]|uniref:hypothetical protein n=1 Tax=Blastococcus sp. VKM Ac-2987 TaxID=3004141 RepID=UPI0022ABB115|nr:hypothetical protein [Blastococcus sp. VKM Ac-2987]MCZ2857700.1 hypothetical protein [Blastococcus sp. VKM Ac-2987]